MEPRCDACGWKIFTVAGKPACECYPYGLATALPMPTPKPATPQPPEWKGEGVVDVGGVKVRWAGVEIRHDTLGRALDDFTARRKAKREAAEINQASIERHGRKRGNFTFRDQRAEPLARAMSTPLPHDPDIHTRLMPWRGKE